MLSKTLARGTGVSGDAIAAMLAERGTTVGFVELKSRRVWWTGRVAIGLRYQSSKAMAGKGANATHILLPASKC